jgi:predicted nuclease of restriction endonuclease-like (RecB) superfamily
MNKLEPILIQDLRGLISAAKNRVAIAVNQEMTILYWNVGKRIQEDILKSERAEYGEKIFITISKQLTPDYGQGFSSRNLARMVRFFENFQDFQILTTLSAKLSWSHFVELMSVSDADAREFYAYMCLQNRWSVRQLSSHIRRLLFECTIGNQKSMADIQKGITILKDSAELTPDLILKDPYILDFLNLPREHYESELEEAILREIEKFILELGTGFSFVARQKRMTIDNEHYFLDLLFYNRKIRRLVAVELKTGRFKAEYIGQMSLYLGWLKRYEMMEEEHPPIGIILCTEKSEHQIELLDLDKNSIHVAQYLTELPTKEIFERKIRDIVTAARKRFETQKNKSDCNDFIQTN